MSPSESRHDPVVAEIHAVRTRLAEQNCDDLVEYTKAAGARCRAQRLEILKSGFTHSASASAATLP